MASPFHVFRKHQKVILVAAGVLCMFVFVIGDVLFQLVPNASRGDGGESYDDVAVRWEGGELSRGDVAGLVQRRIILRNFLRGAVQMGMVGATDATTGPAVKPLMDLNSAEDASPQQMAVYRYLLAEAARKAGMVVSNDAINQYLSQLTQGRVSTEQLRALVANTQVSGRRVSMNYVFEALREEMLATNYWYSFVQSFTTVTPQQRWEDWRKVNDRVIIEHAAIPVGQFVAQIPDPSDDEVLEFFEKYKDAEPAHVFVQPNTQLPSPEPGFRIPRRVGMNYLEANYESLVSQIAKEVTEDEIRQYYEANKETQFVKSSGGFLDGGTPPSDGTTPGGTDSMSDPVEGLPPAPVENGSGQLGPEDQESGATSPAPTEDSASSHFFLPSQESTRYVTFQEDGSEPAPPVDPLSEPDLDGGEREVAAGSGENQPEASAGAEGDIATVAPANPFAEQGANESQLPAVDSAASEDRYRLGEASRPEGLPPEPVEPAQVEYLPLEMVRDKIRRSIADDRVPERVQEIIPEIYTKLTQAFNTYERRRVEVEARQQDPDEVPPPDYDLQRLAEEYGLAAKQTPLLSAIELRETDLGKSNVAGLATPYFSYAFLQQPLYAPVHTQLTVSAFQQMFGGFNEYIAVKVDDQPARTPRLNEIRDEVVRVYQRTKARDLAMDAAEGLAQQVNAGDFSLQQLLGEESEYEVIESDPFSWYDLNLSQFEPRFHLGEPFGVEHPGPDFFETVFSLEPGKAAAVWNHEQSVAYVVRLVRHQMSEDALRNMFLLEGDRNPSRFATDRLRIDRLSSALNDKIMETVDWVIPPDQPREDS